MATTVVTRQKVTLSLPEHLYDYYAERATKCGKNVGDELLAHLHRTKTYNSTTPIYVTDDERNEMSQIAGRSLLTAEDLVKYIRFISGLYVAGATVELSEQVLKRLDSRRFGKSMQEMLIQTVTECLEEKVGLR